MASRALDNLNQAGTHAVGNISSWKIRVLPYGAKVTGANIDNFTFVELGFNAEGERTCTQLSDKANKAYLIASVERRLPEEQLADFYNAVDERGRIVLLDEGVRFESSAFSLNAGVTEAKEGMVAHFDTATKKFIVSEAGSAHLDFAGSSVQLLVVGTESDLEYTTGQALVKFEVM